MDEKGLPKMSSSNSIEIAHSDQELVGSAKKRRQYYVLAGLCVLAVVVILAIVLSVVLLKKDDGKDKRELLNLEDILYGRLQPKRFNGTWVDDNSFHFFDSETNFVLYDVTQKKGEILAYANDSIVLSALTYEFSSDKKYILMASESQKVFRHSFVASWSVYDIAAKTVVPITIGGEARPDIALVKFGPVDNSLIIVYRNNIYFKRSPTDSEIQITNDGSNNVYNGVPDWVNEEEVFSTNSAVWFSPDGKKIAYIRFDDTAVPVMVLPIYGPAGHPEYQYPQAFPVNYPKVAANNPIVKLFYVDLSAVTNTASVVRSEIPVPARFQTTHVDHLITSVSWATNNDLIAVFMNRVQNKGEIQKCSTATTSPSCAAALSLDVDNGWVEFFTAPFYNKEGNRMIFIGSSKGYRHVLSLDLNSNSSTARTSGDFVVTEILAFNKELNTIIYTANTEQDIKAQHIYAVKDEAGAVAACLTCSITTGHTYFSAEVSKEGNHLAISAMGPHVPQTHLFSLNKETANATLKDNVVLEANEALSRSLEGKKMPKITYDTIELENGSVSQVMMIEPAERETGMKYPMIVDVYGGPDSSSVTNRWSVEWGTYLASAHNFIYVKIDGRGAGLRGDKNLFALYRKLGTVEVEDQIETAKKLQQKYSHIDAKRSAIWGWSYGGYVSGMSITHDTEDVFKCAVSVAPVTDWTLYDSIYTERYMGLPTVADNAAAYENSRIMKYVDNIAKYNKSYMLVHGTLDDNVHFQQGMLLARSLEIADIQFKEISYPDEDHSLSKVRKHLYHSLERFFKECFEETA